MKGSGDQEGDGGVASDAGLAGPFPSIPLAGWAASKETLHRFLQIVGKIRLASAPRRNHWWHIAFHLTARGITTRPMGSDPIFAIDFDFVDPPAGDQHGRRQDGMVLVAGYLGGLLLRADVVSAWRPRHRNRHRATGTIRPDGYHPIRRRRRASHLRPVLDQPVLADIERGQSHPRGFRWLEVVSGAGHITPDDGYGPWPEVESWCRSGRANR